VRNLARLQVLAHVEHKNQHVDYNYCSILSISEHISSNTLTFKWLIGQSQGSSRAGTHRNAVPVSFTHKEFPFVPCFSLQIICQILFAWHCMSCIMPVHDYLYCVSIDVKCR
jgi:hypothetical protein